MRALVIIFFVFMCSSWRATAETTFSISSNRSLGFGAYIDDIAEEIEGEKFQSALGAVMPPDLTPARFYSFRLSGSMTRFELTISESKEIAQAISNFTISYCRLRRFGFSAEFALKYSVNTERKSDALVIGHFRTILPGIDERDLKPIIHPLPSLPFSPKKGELLYIVRDQRVSLVCRHDPSNDGIRIYLIDSVNLSMATNPVIQKIFSEVLASQLAKPETERSVVEFWHDFSTKYSKAGLGLWRSPKLLNPDIHFD